MSYIFILLLLCLLNLINLILISNDSILLRFSICTSLMIIADCFASIEIFVAICLISIGLDSGFVGCSSSTCLFWTRLPVLNTAALIDPFQILVSHISYWPC